MIRCQETDARQGGALLLDVHGLSAGYRGQMVVKDIGLRLAAGELVAIVGHNGSGKNTVLLGIAGLIQHTCEQLCLSNVECRFFSTRTRKRQGLGILLQRVAIFPDLSVDANLKLAGYSNSVDFEQLGGDLRTICTDVLARKSALAGVLSGGERRILGLLLAVSDLPRCFLVDEPTLGLSPKLEKQVFEFLRTYTQQHSAGIVVVSHNLRLVQEKCDRAYIIREGRIEVQTPCGTGGVDLEKMLKMSQG